MPLSRGEKLRRKRESEKRRYDRLKQDPEGRAKLKQKEREQYIKKKEKKIVRPINEQNEREQRMKRKHWRKHSRAYRLKKKLSENTRSRHYLISLDSARNIKRHINQVVSTGVPLRGRNAKNYQEEDVNRPDKRTVTFNVPPIPERLKLRAHDPVPDEVQMPEPLVEEQEVEDHPPQTLPSRPQRNRRPPAYLQDYEVKCNVEQSAVSLN
ncbi:hypothetical protein RN001_003507 [Aquatica leii]|uniref:Uncharacterized protein n=1 Tax=Aquatica leii TaxID=1421715 RepID=A0AAN7SE15_9COLE|nr:hypothetical protein RN001_003507 [Aquatica leii]